MYYCGSYDRDPDLHSVIAEKSRKIVYFRLIFNTVTDPLYLTGPAARSLSHLHSTLLSLVLLIPAFTLAY